jgi:hypothetical protein
MVKVAANQFLVVHDTKGLVGPRLGVIDLQKDGPRYQPIDIHNWPSFEDIPNDLEGICAIPNRPREYFLVESGFYPKYGNFGRIIKIRYPGGSVSGAEYVGSFRPLAAPPNGAETPRTQQIEGIAVVEDRGVTVLLLATRGGKESDANKIIAGQLLWGTLTDIDTPNAKFSKSEVHCVPLSYKAIADRGAADLHVMQSANGWDVYSVATSDPSDFGDKNDLGPFRSAVYLAGTLIIHPTISFAHPDTVNIVHWDFDGLKVEAIAEPPEMFKDTAGLVVATDDELYNGIWRPISKSRETRPPSPLLFTVRATEGFSLA